MTVSVSNLSFYIDVNPCNQIKTYL